MRSDNFSSTLLQCCSNI